MAPQERITAVAGIKMRMTMQGHAWSAPRSENQNFETKTDAKHIE